MLMLPPPKPKIVCVKFQDVPFFVPSKTIFRYQGKWWKKTHFNQATEVGNPKTISFISLTSVVALRKKDLLIANDKWDEGEILHEL